MMNNDYNLVAFISGHGDLTENEFIFHYKSMIDNGICLNHTFVVGDFKGADTLAQNYIKSLKYDKVLVFHMLQSPRFNAGFKTVSGFKTDEERDSAMTEISNYDIAWVRPGREKSGTARNIDRRKRLKF